jgi:hypothetical protein
MTLHEVPLILVQWPWFSEDSRVHVDLSDIVENPGEGETIEVVIAQPEAAAQVHREVGDPMHVSVQVLDDVFHHLDEEVVGKLFHANTTE